MTIAGMGLASATGRVAVFIDFENIKRSVDDCFANERVDLKRIFDAIARVTECRIVVKRAYADWGAFKDYRSDLLDNATEAVQAFALTNKGKNGTDVRISIDVMETVLRQSEITHVALVSGDSDFTPLVMKLRALGCFVVGVGIRANTSNYLAKSCDRFVYYDDLREGDDGFLERSGPSMDPGRLLATALASLGNRPVPGSSLKIRMRQIDPLFDETRYGHNSFLEFLRARNDLADVFKPAVGDITVTPKGNFEGEVSFSGAEDSDYLGESNGLGAPSTLAERYRLWLRENNFRYVLAAERREIMRVLFGIFADAEEEDETVSLKEAKDRLHAWFEENRPAVSWDSINSTVYHLFYTWCFLFERGEDAEQKQLWDRRTTLMNDIESEDDLILKCERGVVRKLWERDRGEVDPEALNAWLFDGNESDLDYVKELIQTVSAANFVTVGRGS